jgi:hypothetical protein
MCHSLPFGYNGCSFGCAVSEGVQVVWAIVGALIAASAPVAPPVAILGLPYFSMKGISKTVLDNIFAFFFPSFFPSIPEVELTNKRIKDLQFT